MSDLNRVFLMGRIGNDLELKQSAQGKPYLKISLATDAYRGPGEEKGTHWHRVMVFGNQAQVCATYLKKGAQIVVEGSLEVRTYNDKEGRKTNSVSVIAHRVSFTGGRSAGTPGPEAIEQAMPMAV